MIKLTDLYNATQTSSSLTSLYLADNHIDLLTGRNLVVDGYASLEVSSTAGFKLNNSPSIIIGQVWTALSTTGDGYWNTSPTSNLQVAYTQNPVLVTASSVGDFIIAGTEGFRVTATDGIRTGLLNTDLFTLNVSGSNPFQISTPNFRIGIGSPAIGKVWTASNTSGDGYWGTISQTLAGLSDVQFSGLADAQLLVYNSGSSRWQNRTLSGDASVTDVGLLTVNSVGSSSAANIHTAELAANAATALNTANTIVARDSLGNFSAGTISANISSNTVITTALDVPSPGPLPIGASVGANLITLGGLTSTVSVPGTLQVDGYFIRANATNLFIQDKTINVNVSGNTASAEGAGVLVTRNLSDAYGSLIYAAAATSRFKIGDLGSEKEVADISSTQTFTNKTLSGNTATNLINAAGTFNFNSSGAVTAPNATGTLVLTSETISTSAPLTGGGDLSANRTISIPQATTSVDGYLASIDWNTFNNKLNTSLSNIGASILPSANGGTGVNNAGTLTYGSNNVTLTTSGVTSLTLPTAGILATRAGVEVFTNKTLSGNTATNLINAAGTFNFNSSGTLTAPNVTGTVTAISISSINSNTALVSGTTYLVDTTAARTLTLPAPVNNAFLTIKDKSGSAGVNNITLNHNGSELIDGQASWTLAKNFGTWQLVSDGTNWYFTVSSHATYGN